MLRPVLLAVAVQVVKGPDGWCFSLDCWSYVNAPGALPSVDNASPVCLSMFVGSFNVLPFLCSLHSNHISVPFPFPGHVPEAWKPAKIGPLANGNTIE
ncbi:hypothetical protein B0T20DRAFT_405378 [Sordaria brevicollis]|uniref:Uncharacterized protein n=1 Tax=Sordaria brevicollis TaxID=83679 RepID=A0AAE0PIY2_SORBR|nr:hypothetical protein B0T20DRAFT_405378 [Sordaria brevicollis]